MKTRNLQVGLVLVMTGLVATTVGRFVATASPAQAAVVQAAAYLPDNLIAVATLRDGDKQVAAFRQLLAEQQFQASPTYRLLMNNPETLQARIGLLGFTQAAGTDVWTALGSVLGREFVVGLAPGPDDEPRFIAVSVLRNHETIEQLLKAVHIMTGLEIDGEPNPEKSRMVDGVRVFSVDGNLFHCLTSDALIATNDGEMIQAAIRARNTKQSRLIDSAGYRQAAAHVPDRAVAWAYADLTIIRAAIAEGGALPTQLPDPLSGLLFGAWWHSIAHGDTAVVWATTENNALTFNGLVDSKTPLPPAARGYLETSAGSGPLDADKLPRFMAELSVARGWADLFAERETLMTPSAATDLAGFSSVMTTLMGQMDFVDEFLPDVAGPVRLVLARQDFSAASRVPTPKLPAFALVIPFRTDVAGDLARRLNTVSMQALAFLNLSASEENRPSFLINTELYRNHLIVAAEYPDQPAGRRMQRTVAATATSEGTGVSPTATQPKVGGIHYNFAPAAAVVGSRYIIATSTELLRSIIDAVAERTPESLNKTTAPAVDRLVIRGREVLAILRDNLNELVANRMLETDRPRRQVEREIEGFLGALAFVKQLELTSQSTGTQSKATLTLALRDAPAGRPQ